VAPPAALQRRHCDHRPSNRRWIASSLELARQVQLRLLPERRCCLSDWEVAFSYESAGFVSGDYVDLIPAGADAFYFALGGVSGKGVAASMLMSHLHAMSSARDNRETRCLR